MGPNQFEECVKQNLLVSHFKYSDLRLILSTEIFLEHHCISVVEITIAMSTEHAQVKDSVAILRIKSTKRRRMHIISTRSREIVNKEIDRSGTLFADY